MQSSAETLFEAALGVPENERLALVSRLLEAVPADDSAISLDDDSLVEELDRRFADRDGSIDWSALRAVQYEQESPSCACAAESLTCRLPKAAYRS